MTAPSLLVARQGAVAVVTLNRPERRNALDATLIGALLAAAAELAADTKVRAVVLTGTGRMFCSGADLAAEAFPVAGERSRGAAVSRVLRDYFNPLARAWASLPKPVVVALNGSAAGGGVGLALCGDLLLMSATASLNQVFVPKLALVPDVGASFFMTRALGAARARALAMLGTPVTAPQAVDWGLALDTVPETELESRALALATSLAAGPTQTYAAVKQLLGAAGSELDAQLERECEWQGILADSLDHAEGLAAFAERRDPVFKGR